MSELIYPIETVATVIRGSASEKNEEMLPIVNPLGVVVGQASRSFAHSGEKLLHPVVHLHLIDRSGRVYLQKRAVTKKLLPGRWDTAVGGHVSYGESIREALYRESSEELRMYDYNPVFLGNYVFESRIEQELVHVFAAVGNFTPEPDPEEVEQGRYWTAEEIEEARGKDILTPNFEGEYDRFKDSFQALL